MTSVKSMISRGALAPGYGLEPDAIALRLIKSTGRQELRRLTRGSENRQKFRRLMPKRVMITESLRSFRYTQTLESKLDKTLAYE
ncbi:MAG: hypothetical protein AAF664_13020 [Planctomycetota bacterium]